jgi:hypothetical protein
MKIVILPELALCKWGDASLWARVQSSHKSWRKGNRECRHDVTRCSGVHNESGTIGPSSYPTFSVISKQSPPDQEEEIEKSFNLEASQCDASTRAVVDIGMTVHRGIAVPFESSCGLGCACV